MKSNYKPILPQIHGNDLKEIAEEFTAMYYKWLDASGISEDEFLKFGELKPFKIQKYGICGITHISLSCGGVSIGQPLISIGDDCAFAVNAAYMLLYIAKKLDGADGGSYFYDTARAFNVANIGNV